MQLYVIAGSPLAKIFQTNHVPGLDPLPENKWPNYLMRNPDKVVNEDAFEVMVKRATGGLKFNYMVPKQVTARDDQAAKAVYEWLIDSQESDCYGLVPFEAGFDAMAVMSQILEFDHMALVSDDKRAAAAKAKRDDLQKSIRPSLKNAMEKAREKADERVMKNIKRVYEMLMRQYELNREQNLGLYTPSPVEYVCTYILRDEIEKAEAATKKMNEQFASMVEKTRVLR